MWDAFKRELFERIHKFIPRVNNFSSWKKDSWERPLHKLSHYVKNCIQE